MPIRVVVWNEGRDEKTHPVAKQVYPEGIHEVMARYLRERPDLDVRTATLDTDPEHGLSQQLLDQTDVLTWWGHMHHGAVRDDVVDRVHNRVLSGMGLIVLHSAHYSKIFRKLMGTTCDLKWRDKGEREILWVTCPGHPIVKDLEDHFLLDKEEMYGEFFDVPEPMQTLLISHFEGGEVFRSAMTWQRGLGRIFYFRPGHETMPTFYNPTVMRVIENAIRWAAPAEGVHTALRFGKHPDGWMERHA